MTTTPEGTGGGGGGISILGSASRLHPSLPAKPVAAAAEASSSSARERDVRDAREHRGPERGSYRGRELLATRASTNTRDPRGAAMDADTNSDAADVNVDGGQAQPLQHRLRSAHESRRDIHAEAVHGSSRQPREAPPRGHEDWRDAPPHTRARSHGDDATPPHSHDRERDHDRDRGDWGGRRAPRYGFAHNQQPERDTYRPHDTYRPDDTGSGPGTSSARDDARDGSSPGRRIRGNEREREREREREGDRERGRDRELDEFGRDDRHRIYDNDARFRQQQQRHGDRGGDAGTSSLSLDPSGSGGSSYRPDLQHPLPPPPHSMPSFKPTLPVNRDHRGSGTAGMGPGAAQGGNAGPPTGHGNLNFEQRRQLRESTQVNIWPESPKRPYAELNDKDDKAHRSKREKDKDKTSSSKSRRKRRYTSETDSDEEYERERRRRKRREREKDKDRERDEGREKRRRRVDTDDERERDRDRKRDRERDRDRDRDRQRTRTRSPEHDRDRQRTSTRTPERERETSARAKSPVSDDDGPEVGPQLPPQLDIKDKSLDRDAYRDLLPGEGEAMAAFIKSGQRIPRRGEIGMDQAQIAALEGSGYVMSGSRHQRMNAVRIRKEGQVMDAEEKRAFLKQQREDWLAKEGAIISQFKEMRDEQLKLEERRRRERERSGDREGKGKGRE